MIVFEDSEFVITASEESDFYLPAFSPLDDDSTMQI